VSAATSFSHYLIDKARSGRFNGGDGKRSPWRAENDVKDFRFGGQLGVRRRGERSGEGPVHVEPVSDDRRAAPAGAKSYLAEAGAQAG